MNNEKVRLNNRKVRSMFFSLLMNEGKCQCRHQIRYYTEYQIVLHGKISY